jgi:uncharacterized protein (AIM24 family)
LFFAHWLNSSGSPQRIGLAQCTFGNIVGVHLNEFPDKALIIQHSGFLCSSAGVKFEAFLQKKFGTGFFSGEGFILQKCTGDEGFPNQVWMHGGGTIVKKEINEETGPLTLECGAFMASTTGIEMDIGFNSGVTNACCGGEGLFLTKLSGTGTVWIQVSDCESNWYQTIIAAIPQKNKDDGGGGGD